VRRRGWVTGWHVVVCVGGEGSMRGAQRALMRRGRLLNATPHHPLPRPRPPRPRPPPGVPAGLWRVHGLGRRVQHSQGAARHHGGRVWPGRRGPGCDRGRKGDAPVVVVWGGGGGGVGLLRAQRGPPVGGGGGGGGGAEQATGAAEMQLAQPASCPLWRCST
jgi:hypothetical protein